MTGSDVTIAPSMGNMSEMKVRLKILPKPQKLPYGGKLLDIADKDYSLIDHNQFDRVIKHSNTSSFDLKSDDSDVAAWRHSLEKGLTRTNVRK